MMGWSPRCYISSFLKISPLVLEMIFNGFTIYGRGSHLGHVTQMPRTNSRSPTRGSTQILALIGQSVSEEKMFEECERTTTDAGAWVYYKLTCEPAAKVS